MNDDILYSPDVVDFIFRKNSCYQQYILTHPGLITAHSIDDAYIICYATKDAFIEMASHMGTDYINNVPYIVGLTDQESLEASGITAIQQQPFLNLKGRGVLIGFVDTGIDYTQEIFRYEDGSSKILSIYDQTIPGNPPANFPFGTEYTNEQITAALSSENPYELVPHRDTEGHGTFLASVAAGRQIGDFIGAAPDAEIVMVKLKKAYPFYLEEYCVPPEQENAFESTSVMIGVQYLLQKSRELNRPIAICIGLGSNYESHHSYGFLEEYLYYTCNIPGVCTCTSVGNESQSRHHYSETFSQEGTPKDIQIRVGPNAGDLFVVITNRISDRISLSLRSPTGEVVSRIPARSAYTFTAQFVLEPSRISISYYFPLMGSGDQISIVRILNATSGIWTITVYGDIIINGRVDAWLPITDFVATDVEFLSFNPYNTVTAPATGFGTIRCGAYNSFRNSLYPRSSWGPTRVESSVPDLVAPGYRVGGFYPTGYGYMDGTSVSAAITAGACALMLQWGIVEGNDLGFCTPLIRAYLIRGCSRSDLIEYPNPQWGYGALNLLQTFMTMRQL